MSVYDSWSPHVCKPKANTGLSSHLLNDQGDVRVVEAVFKVAILLACIRIAQPCPVRGRSAVFRNWLVPLCLARIAAQSRSSMFQTSSSHCLQ